MIENALAAHPAVVVAAAVGMPDAYAGELPVRFVQLHLGQDIIQAVLQAHARDTIDERLAWAIRDRPVIALWHCPGAACCAASAA